MEIATKAQFFLLQLGVSTLKILLILALLGVAFLLFMVFSAAHVKVDKRDIFPLPKEKETGKTVTIGFFSDTHGFGCLRSPQWVAGTFLNSSCDLVLFGGDCVHKKTVRPSDKKMLTEVSSLLSGKNIPLYAVYGNHDWLLEDADFKEMGAILLREKCVIPENSPAPFALCGVSDNERGLRSWGYMPDEFKNYDGFRLLLVHNPDFLYTLPDREKEKDAPVPFDYMLAGHLHGGQVHLPFNLEFALFREDRIVRDAGILGGPFTFRGYKGFISNGLGTGALPIRFMARPEIHIFKFHI